MNLKIGRLVGLVSAVLLAAQMVSAAVFTGTGVGSIPDSTFGGPVQYSSSRVVSFNVSGLSSAIQSVALSITMQHPYLGDLDVRLASPNGTNFIIFSNCEGPPGGPEGYGCGLDLNGAYQFSDAATNTLRNVSDQMAASFLLGYGTGVDYTNVIPAGFFLPSTPGPFADAPTRFTTNSGFVGLTPPQANGTWTLTFRDGSGGGAGSVSAATLTILTTTAPFFSAPVITNGNLKISLAGSSNQSFRLWRSTNVALPFPSAWESFYTNAFDGSGNASLTTDKALPQRFYRASVP